VSSSIMRLVFYRSTQSAREIDITNLTINVYEKVIQDARIRALKQGTSANVLLREYLEAYAAQEENHLRLREFLGIAKNSRAASRWRFMLQWSGNLTSPCLKMKRKQR
jgi:hypothetical protein